MKNLIAIFLFSLFIWQPVKIGISQVKPGKKKDDNAALKIQVDAKADTALAILSELKNNKESEKPRIIYRYKTITKVRVDTVYFPQPDSCCIPDFKLYLPDNDVNIIHDTVVIHDTIKKLNFLQRLFQKRK